MFPQNQKVFISCNDRVGVGGQGRCEHEIVVWITTNWLGEGCRGDHQDAAAIDHIKGCAFGIDVELTGEFIRELGQQRFRGMPIVREGAPFQQFSAGSRYENS